MVVLLLAKQDLSESLREALALMGQRTAAYPSAALSVSMQARPLFRVYTIIMFKYFKVGIRLCC